MLGRPQWQQDPQDNGGAGENNFANIGKSFMVGVQVLAPTITGATMQGGPYDRDMEAMEWIGGRMLSKNKGCCSQRLLQGCGPFKVQRSSWFGTPFNKSEKLPHNGIAYTLPWQSWQNKLGNKLTRDRISPNKPSRTSSASISTQEKWCQCMDHWHRGESWSSHAIQWWWGQWITTGNKNN